MLQSFKSFQGNYHVWLLHHNGQSHWDSHSDFEKAKADAVFAAHEHRCKAIVMHDNFKLVATALPDGKMRTHVHEEHLDEYYLKENDDRTGHNIFHAAAEKKQDLLKDFEWTDKQIGKLPENHKDLPILKRERTELNHQLIHHQNIMDKHFYHRKDNVYISKGIGYEGVPKTPLRHWRDDWLTDMENHYKTSSSDRKKIKRELFYRGH